MYTGEENTASYCGIEARSTESNRNEGAADEDKTLSSTTAAELGEFGVVAVDFDGPAGLPTRGVS